MDETTHGIIPRFMKSLFEKITVQNRSVPDLRPARRRRINFKRDGDDATFQILRDEAILQCEQSELVDVLPPSPEAIPVEGVWVSFFLKF